MKYRVEVGGNWDAIVYGKNSEEAIKEALGKETKVEFVGVEDEGEVCYSYYKAVTPSGVEFVSVYDLDERYDY